MKNNVSFVAGFERAQRMNLINQQLYDLGCEYFEKGILLEDTPENYKNNEYFVAGYNESNTKKK